MEDNTVRYTFMKVGALDEHGKPAPEKFFLGRLPLEGEAVEMVYVGMEGNDMRFQLRVPHGAYFCKGSTVMLTEHDLYYLRSIQRQLSEMKEALADFSLGGLALADNLEWLDCFIDKHERAEPPPHRGAT